MNFESSFLALFYSQHCIYKFYFKGFYLVLEDYSNVATVYCDIISSLAVKCISISNCSITITDKVTVRPPQTDALIENLSCPEMALEGVGMTSGVIERCTPRKRS